MTAEYILKLVVDNKDEIINFPTPQERMNKIINIAENAPVPPGTPPDLAFLDILNEESNYLIQAIKRYQESGRLKVVPINELSQNDAYNVQSALNIIYDLCEDVEDH